MTAHELLAELFGLFRPEFPKTEFREAYPPELCSRMPAGPLVSGTVAEEKTEGENWKARLDLRVFLPRTGAAEDGEPLLGRMTELAREHCPQFTGASRGAAVREKAAGFLEIPCSLFFSRSGGQSGGIRKAVLGGLEYTVSGAKTSISRKGEEIVSFGEEEPFAVRGERTAYTVELEGIDVDGLERLAGFTAELGEPPEIYLGCRWKSLSPADRTAVFVSSLKREGV